MSKMAKRVFTRAIVRIPGENFSQGITTSDLGKPNYRLALEQHYNYCKSLKECGLELIVLEPDLDFPDSTFVEDTAIVMEEGAVITRPGDKRRRGEEGNIKKELSRHREIEAIYEPGTVDGGDILRVKDHFYIGLSARTNSAGGNQLKGILRKYGYSSSMVQIDNMLHLKSGVNFLDQNNLVIWEELKHLPEFKGFDIISVISGEKYAANCMLINNRVLIPSGFPDIKEKLEARKYQVLEQDVSEFEKMDGGLTCLSIRF